MYVENGWLSLDPIYLSLLHSHKFSDNFSDMDVRAQGFLSYHLIKVPWFYLRTAIIIISGKNRCLEIHKKKYLTERFKEQTKFIVL